MQKFSYILIFLTFCLSQGKKNVLFLAIDGARTAKSSPFEFSFYILISTRFASGVGLLRLNECQISSHRCVGQQIHAVRACLLPGSTLLTFQARSLLCYSSQISQKR
eukprot:m.135148 g.135148  ORF g.135148 m.135148 type:complete len:107 (+) comp38157_c0_seq34:295-615(+)